MTLKLLVRKLYLSEKRFITRKDLKSLCNKLKIDYYTAINYLLRNSYLIRILRGIFYIKSVEERKFDKTNINYFEAIKEALKLKNIKNWYFGLETAIKLNNLTHEYFATDYIINDKIFRPKPIPVLGHKIKFIKLKRTLVEFGIIGNTYPYSDPEKTLLDFIYLSRYNRLDILNLKDRINILTDKCSKKKIKKYVERYPKSVKAIADELL